MIASESQSRLSPADSKKGGMLGLERPAVSMNPLNWRRLGFGGSRDEFANHILSVLREHRGALNLITRMTATQSDRATLLIMSTLVR